MRGDHNFGHIPERKLVDLHRDWTFSKQGTMAATSSCYLRAKNEIHVIHLKWERFVPVILTRIKC